MPGFRTRSTRTTGEGAQRQGGTSVTPAPHAMSSFALHGIGVCARHRHRPRAARHQRHASRSRTTASRRSGVEVRSRASTTRCARRSRRWPALAQRMAGECAAGIRRAFSTCTDDPERPTLAEAPAGSSSNQHCNAEWALTQQVGGWSSSSTSIEDTYLRERKADVVQVVERVLKAADWAARGRSARRRRRRTDVLVAHDLSPADVIQFKQHRFGASSPTWAARLRTPRSSRAASTCPRSSHCTTAAADPRERAADRRRHRQRRHRQSGQAACSSSTAEAGSSRPRARKAPAARGPSGRRRSTAGAWSCRPTSSCPADVAQTQEQRRFRHRPVPLASSCSSSREGLPSEDEQFEAYREVGGEMGGKPVTIRTLDLGADKHRPGRRGLALRAESGAGLARHAPLPGRAADVPHSAARDPARVALRQDARSWSRCWRRSPRSTRRCADRRRRRSAARPRGIVYDREGPPSAA